MPQVVIARVNGFCYTGALELALACDLIVTADEAKLADTHAKWGLRPTWGMSQRLVRLVGVGRARELSYTAQPISGSGSGGLGSGHPVGAPATTWIAPSPNWHRRLRTTAPDRSPPTRTCTGRPSTSGLTEGLAYEAETRLPDHRHRRAGWRRSDESVGRIVAGRCRRLSRASGVARTRSPG